MEHEDGTVGYFALGQSREAFRVRIADVTAFSVVEGPRSGIETLKLLGHGTELASVDVVDGVPTKIEQWFRAHPSFDDNTESSAQAGQISNQSGIQSSPPVADELRKLADLRSEGILTDDEFEGHKSGLLGG